VRRSKKLEEDYQLRGWDEDTGVPLYETLKSLDLEDIAKDVK